MHSLQKQQVSAGFRILPMGGTINVPYDVKVRAYRIAFLRQ